MSEKISQLVERVAITGLEEVPVAIDGSNAKVKLNRIKTLITKSDVGLGSVDNTADVDKPISSAQATALAGKANVTHSHGIEQITGLTTALDSKADTSHQHEVTDINGLDTLLAGKADAQHSHTIENIDGLEQALSEKANSAHSHAIGDVSGLQTSLDGLQNQINQKSAVGHSHAANEISGLEPIVQAIVDQIPLTVDASEVTGFADAAITALQSADYPGLTNTQVDNFDNRVIELIQQNGGGGGTSDLEVGLLEW